MIKFIDLFGITIPSYMLCSVLGLCAAILFAYFRNRNQRVKWSSYYLFAVFSLIGMLLGSKLLFFITVLPTIFDDLTLKNALVLFLNSGFVFYGGLLGALSAGSVSVKISKANPREMFNIFIPPFVLFHTFGRVGCFLTGCCYGIEFPLGFSYPYEPNVLRFPVQLAEALWNIVILAILLYRERKSQGENSLVALYLIMYAPMRFILEFLRDDSIRGIWGFLSTSQWISIFVIAAVTVLFFKKRQFKTSR